MNNRGFTIIELLVVISIIAVLASMMIVGVQGFLRNTKKMKTEQTVKTIAVELGKRSAEIGSDRILALHPFASFDEPRASFVRGKNEGTLSQGSQVLSSGLAFRSEKVSYVGGSAGTLLWPNDVFVGLNGYAPESADVPLLYGLERYKMRLISSSWRLSEHKRVGPDGVNARPEYRYMMYDRPVNMSDGDKGKVNNMATSSNDRIVMDQTNLLDIDDEEAFEAKVAKGFAGLLGGIEEELLKLDALVNTDKDNGALAVDNKIRQPNDGRTMDAWPMPERDIPGSFYLDAVEGKWKQYRLRGKALYDAWGRELLFYSSGKGSLSIVSAGRDGSFKWFMGKDRVFSTPAYGQTAQGDDTDATTDNIVQGQW